MFQTNNIEDRVGRCYEYAFKTVERYPQFTLVHGIGINTKDGKIMGHAWCELGNLAYDAVMDEAIPKEQYYRVFQVSDTFKYTLQEARELVSMYHHYGYWNKGMNRAYPDGVEVFFEKDK